LDRKILNAIKTLIIIVLVCSFFVGCGYTPEEIFKMNSYKAQGESNAVNFIKEKYGFTPQVISVKNEYDPGGPIPDFSPMPNGYVHALMKYKGKEFTVEIKGTEKSLDGADDFEKEEILTYLDDAIKEKYPMVEEAEFYYYEQDYSYFSDRLTYDNFYDYTKDSYIVIKLCDKDVNDFPLQDFMAYTGCEDVNVINYKDKGKMPLMFNSGISTSTEGYDMDSILPYINQYLYFSVHSDEPLVWDVYTEYDDEFVVCTLEDEKVKIIKESKLLSDIDLLPSQKYIASYQLQTNAEDVWVYLPKDLVDEDETIDIYANRYEELVYESLDYMYFDNLTIQDDFAGDYKTGFKFAVCSEKKK
jgi:hypothetical protein